MSCPLPSPQKPTSPSPLHGSTSFSNTPALGGAEHAGEKYIYPKTHVCVYLNQIPPVQNVKIRRVRGLAAFGGCRGGLGLGVASGGFATRRGGRRRRGLSIRRFHVTLYGKIAAFSHHDVLKTTEPLTCSDGVRNFTCLLSKTSITPILRELKKIDVAPEVSPVARRWVLVLDFNFTEGSWRWRNVTVVRGWELKWSNETAYVFQAQIKKSLGEMIKIQKEVD
jgi:hypothetical protein